MKKKMKQPDPKLHQQLSFVKSGIRIVAGLSLALIAFGHLYDGELFLLAGVGLVVAEVIGIVEELV